MPRGVYERSEEHRAKLSVAISKRRHSEETKAKMSASQKARPYRKRNPPSEETRAKISAAKKGKVPKNTHTPEAIAKRVAKLKGVPRSEEVKAKVSASKRANPHIYTEEQRRKMSEAQKRYNATLTEAQRIDLHANWIKAVKDTTNRPMSDTSIELFVAAFLDQAGVEYVHPYPVGAMEADFYLPATNTIVEVQGCYWHGCEPCGFTGKDAEQQRMKDKRRFGYFAAKGYKIRTIWEHDIKKNILDNLMKLL